MKIILLFKLNIYLGRICGGFRAGQITIFRSESVSDHKNGPLYCPEVVYYLPFSVLFHANQGGSSANPNPFASLITGPCFVDWKMLVHI